MEQFERSIKSSAYPGMIPRLDREPRDSRFFYQNGEANNLFIAYLLGYGHAKINYRNEQPIKSTV